MSLAACRYGLPGVLLTLVLLHTVLQCNTQRCRAVHGYTALLHKEAMPDAGTTADQIV